MRDGLNGIRTMIVHRLITFIECDRIYEAGKCLTTGSIKEEMIKK